MMSPTEDIQLVIEPSATFENKCSFGTVIANEECETSFDNSSKL